MMKTIDYELVFEGKEYRIEAELDYYSEEYGADADGNRGVMRQYCEVNQTLLFDDEGKEINYKDWPKGIEDVLEVENNDRM